ncbi:BON domain-containing protein [Nitrosomonas supralitoralis]|uniref:Transporter n=1 Tax=Nitrosomonas supralitoralis TaxID=2116706 RepID=A0A2P7NVR5_9PROT|nr:BON domain-containing protein [Nitrosomonas supralitoralis]PSJ17538.1 transporter [Nitrosomonas supralitoralis]
MIRHDSSPFIVFFLIFQIAMFSGCVSMPEQRGMEEKFNDVRITTKVYEAIIDEPSLRRFDINIRTIKGVVELSGYVNSRDDIDKAIAIARTIEGIKSIKNDMLIGSINDDY